MGAGRIRRHPWLARCGLAVAAFALAARLGDELLRFLLLDCPPAYWLPSHAPHRNVTAIVGSIRAEWTTNSLGFHDREHAIAAPSGARRLVCIGDSFLEGPALAVGQAEAYFEPQISTERGTLFEHCARALELSR